MRVRRGLLVGTVAMVLLASACDSTVVPSPSAEDTGAPPASVAATDAPSSGPLAPAAGLLLNEVRFAPAGGDPAFVELANLGSGPADLSGLTLQLAGNALPLGNPASLPAGGFLLVLLDGQGSVASGVIHGQSGIGLPADVGSVALLDPSGARLDRIAWGDGDPGAVNPGPGGLVPAGFDAGSTISRAPGATTPNTPEEWFVASAGSPGEANPAPTVGVTLPLSGAILDPSAANLSWYPVPGAASYRVQVDTEDSFAGPDIDTTVTEARMNVGALGPGAYVWRVQAIRADDGASAFSEPSRLELASASTAALVSLLDDTPGKHLSVPLIAQRKDTAMLLLERNVETGAHAWDRDHGTTDENDPADNMNCVAAMIAMLDAFYGGNLSQDRIGYEALQRRGGNPSGPEGDLIYGHGINPGEATALLRWAIGGVTEGGVLGFDETWNTIVSEVDAGRPLGGANTRHAFVVTGYEVSKGRQFIWINDPWHGRSYKQDIAVGGLPALLWLMPSSASALHQEPGVTADADGDGVVDFDESERFKTDPDAADTDGDDLPDKADIITGVFDPKYGYAVTHGSPFGRDYDSDGTPTERDQDSDDGGCNDGREDADMNGHRNGSETSNFDGDDDLCTGWRGVITGTWDYPHHERVGHLTATVFFEPDPNPAHAEYLIATSGSVTWTETGDQGPNCTVEGGGTYSVVVPGDETKEPFSRSSWLRIFDGGDEGGLRYSGLGHHETATQDQVFTVITCDGHPSHLPTDAFRWMYFGISDDPAPEIGNLGDDSRIFPKNATSFSGTYTVRSEGVEGVTWTWTFTKVGH